MAHKANDTNKAAVLSCLYTCSAFMDLYMHSTSD